MQKRAAGIDVGTNSIKTAIGELDPIGDVNIIHEDSANARLGEGFDATKKLQPEAMERAIDAIGRQVEAARSMGTEKIRMVGTSAVRDAENNQEFIGRIQRELGVRLEPIDEEEEAGLAYTSVVLDPELKHFTGSQVVVDIGGGSTELIIGAGEETLLRTSVRIGAVRLTERYLRSAPDHVCQLVDAALLAERMVCDKLGNHKVDRVVAIGGSALNIARMWTETPIERTNKVHGRVMGYQDLRRMVNMLYVRTPEERKQLVGLEPERADIILAGAIILERILAATGSESAVISARGIRHALVYEMLASHES